MMTPKATLLAAMLPALLGGCVAPLVTPGRCVATETAGWIGQRYDYKLERRIGDLTHASHVRVIRPGMMVTKDFRENRANIALNERDIVTGIYCG